MATSAEALAALNSFNATRKSATDVMSESDSKYDVSGISSRVDNLKGLTNSLQSAVEAVDPSVTGRTSGSFVTEAQRSALIGREKAPILQDLNKQQVAYGEEQQALTSARTLSGQYASAILGDQNTRYSTLTDQYNAAVQKEKDDEANRQWWANFNEQKRQYEQGLALQTRQLQEQIRASQASTNAVLAQIQAQRDAQNAASQAAKDAQARQDAINKAARIAKAKAEADAAAEASRQAQANMPLSYWDSITKYGPLALFGGGWAWK